MAKTDLKTVNELDSILYDLQDTLNFNEALLTYLVDSFERAEDFKNKGTDDSKAMILFFEVQESSIRKSLAFGVKEKLKLQIEKLQELTSQSIDTKFKGEQ